jgi:membrane-associated phospholipid phosphatase
LLVAFLALAVVAHGLRADSFDLWISRHIQGVRWLETPMRAVSWPGYAWQTYVLFGLVIATMVAAGRRAEAVFLFLSVGVSDILCSVAKTLVARPRPAAPLVRVLHASSGNAFPSGHVVGYVCCFGFLAYLAWTGPRSSWPRGLAIAVCAGLIVLVGPSRIYLGAHWATDVLGGYLLGGLWLSIALRAYVAWLSSNWRAAVLQHGGRFYLAGREPD